MSDWKRMKHGARVTHTKPQNSGVVSVELLDRRALEMTNYLKYKIDTYKKYLMLLKVIRL